ncbi:MAG TPA: MgtC/SapB family protein [Silvibacterium sp.]|nr:MgtC/SapB family protein [Silvibacterium sp.]
MPYHITWEAIALRLVLTVAAGALLGIDRSEHEHPAGLRTTLLVTLAASVAMIQMNLLMPTSGKSPSSFSVMDIMRLPLGILTGVGFIGAGAIVRRGDMVSGVTTAATMWFATVVGLCMGGGQVILGCVSTTIGCIVLWNLKWIEVRLHRIKRASLIVTTDRGTWTETEFRSVLASGGITIKTLGVILHSAPEPVQTFDCYVQWHQPKAGAESPSVLREFSDRPGLISLAWKPTGAPPT